MKEIEKKLKDKTELQVQKQQQIQREFLGSVEPHPGHKIFEIDSQTLKIELATYIEKKTFDLSSKTSSKKEVLIREGYHYVSAMNKENAMKKYKKGKHGLREQTKEPLRLVLNQRYAKK